MLECGTVHIAVVWTVYQKSTTAKGGEIIVADHKFTIGNINTEVLERGWSRRTRYLSIETTTPVRIRIPSDITVDYDFILWKIRCAFLDLSFKYCKVRGLSTYDRQYSNTLILRGIDITCTISKKQNREQVVAEVVTKYYELLTLVVNALGGTVEFGVDKPEDNIEHQADLVAEALEEISLDMHGGDNNSQDLDHKAQKTAVQAQNDESSSNSGCIGNNDQNQRFIDVSEEVRKQVDLQQLLTEIHTEMEKQKRELRKEFKREQKMKKIDLKKLVRAAKSPVHIGLETVKADKSNREFYNLFKRIATEGEGNGSSILPKWNPQKVSRSLLTWKLPHQIRDRKTQSEVAKGAWMCIDTSGSMGPFIHELSRIAALVSAQVPQVAVLDVPNMWFEKLVFYKSKAVTLKLRQKLDDVEPENRWALLKDLIGVAPKWIIIISDGDGYNFLVDEVYPEFPCTKFVYLDAYCCSQLDYPVERTRDKLEWAPKPASWFEWYGVGTVNDVVEVLKTVIR